MEVSRDKIKEIVRKVMRQESQESSDDDSSSVDGVVLSPSPNESKILVREEDVRKAMDEGILYVTSDYIITPSASDLVRDNKVDIREISEKKAKENRNSGSGNQTVESVAIGSDHRGFSLKEDLKKYLTEEKGIKVNDQGPLNSERCDFPEYALKVAEAVSQEVCDRGIMIDGIGVGSSVAVNKVEGIRGTLCNDLMSAESARAHSNSNVLLMGSDIVSPTLAQKIVNKWLETKFLGGTYAERMEMIEKYNQKR